MALSLNNLMFKNQDAVNFLRSKDRSQSRDTAWNPNDQSRSRDNRGWKNPNKDNFQNSLSQNISSSSQLPDGYQDLHPEPKTTGLVLLHAQELIQISSPLPEAEMIGLPRMGLIEVVAGISHVPGPHGMKSPK